MDACINLSTSPALTGSLNSVRPPVRGFAVHGIT